MTISSNIPTRTLGKKVPAMVEGGNPDGTSDPWPVSLVSVDYDFFKTYGLLPCVQGRTFSTAADSGSFVVNEAAANAFHWESAVGKTLEMTYNAGDGTIENRKGNVIGVIKDFHFESLHKKIQPMVFLVKPYWYYFITVKLAPGNPEESLQALKKKWETLEPQVPFEYSFMDQKLADLYETERGWSQRINLFSGIAVLISCLGLFGLASFILQNKMKEIAIRKIHGAGLPEIVAKLYWLFFRIIVTGSAVGIPVSWFLCDQWLSGFAYHYHVGIGQFIGALAGVTLLLTTILAGQVIKASRMNPVEMIKAE
jgi:putative ABC transport system permease protein